MKFSFELMTDEAIARFLAAKDIGNSQLCAEIARNDQQIAQAKFELISREIAEAERE